MATTTTTTPNAPNLLTLVTDTESIVSSIDSLTSYLDSELAPSTKLLWRTVRYENINPQAFISERDWL